jgi:hypothetical protein
MRIPCCVRAYYCEYANEYMNVYANVCECMRMYAFLYICSIYDGNFKKKKQIGDSREC